MGKEELPINIEEEPIKESEITCDFCGPSVQAAWDVVTDENEVVFVCHKHHLELLERDLVFVERRIGDMTWEDSVELKKFLNEYEREKNIH